MKKLLFFLFCLLSTSIALQAQHCGTPHEQDAELLMAMPYFGNMAFLQNIADSVNARVNNPAAPIL